MAMRFSTKTCSSLVVRIACRGSEWMGMIALTNARRQLSCRVVIHVEILLLAVFKRRPDVEIEAKFKEQRE